LCSEALAEAQIGPVGNGLGNALALAPPNRGARVEAVKWAILAVAVVGVLAVLWFAGEQHRQNCEDAGRVSCTVLPWGSGRFASGSGTALRASRCWRAISTFSCDIAHAASRRVVWIGG